MIGTSNPSLVKFGKEQLADIFSSCSCVTLCHPCIPNNHTSASVGKGTKGKLPYLALTKPSTFTFFTSLLHTSTYGDVITECIACLSCVLSRIRHYFGFFKSSPSFLRLPRYSPEDQLSIRSLEPVLRRCH